MRVHIDRKQLDGDAIAFVTIVLLVVIAVAYWVVRNRPLARVSRCDGQSVVRRDLSHARVLMISQDEARPHPAAE